MIDLKHEIERELSLIDPPDLWDRIQADASNNTDGSVLDLTTARHRRRPSLWLAVAAVTVLLALVGALVLLDDHQTVKTTPVTKVPVVPEPPTNHGGPTTLAKGENVHIGGFGGLAGQTLNIDAVEQVGEVTGEFRVNNVVVTLQCADISSDTRDLILGGEVTDNPNRLATLDHVNVAVGDLVALIIRNTEPNRERVTLYHPSQLPAAADLNANPGSCTELVASVPGSLDGGFFNDVADGYNIETGQVPFSTTSDAGGPTTLAKGEGLEIGGQTLNIDAVEQDGKVTGEFRVNNVVVTLQCADTQTNTRDLILGGQVTDDPDGAGLVADVGDATVARRDLVALIIRRDDPDSYRVTLYANKSAGSCTELVESVPFNLDDGFFAGGDVGNIETG